MLNNHRFLSMSSLGILMACSFACAQENAPKDNKTAAAEVPDTIRPEQFREQANENIVNTDGSISKEELMKVSEAFGHFIGRNLKAPGLNFDIDSIIKGMRAGYNGQPAPMSDKEYETMMAKIQEQAYKQVSIDNLKAANEFFAKNAKASGIIEVEPGKLQYSIIKEGTGPEVQAHSSPQIQYTGKFLDGSVFSSSSETGGPITIPLDQTIPGFSKGILGMKEGEKRALFVHPDLGYGTTGHLPPNSLLIFDIEVIKANSSESPDAMEEDLSDLSMSEDDREDDEDDEDDEDKTSKGSQSNEDNVKSEPSQDQKTE